MKLQTSLAGSYPKLPVRAGDVNLRVVRNRLDQGKAGPDDLDQAVRDTTRRILGIQERAGVDLLMDGSAGWDDAQTFVACRLEGFRIAGLIRYLDTNTYYRQPEIVGDIAWKSPITVADFQAAQAMTQKPVKAFLPGPYSLYRFSKDLHYRDAVRACEAIGHALAREAAALEEAGAQWIHFEEPWLGRLHDMADHAAAARAGLLPLLTGRKAKTVLHVPFGSPSKAVFEAVRPLPWDVIGLDLVEAPAAWELIPSVPKGRGVALGLIDARNTRLERTADVVGLVQRAASLRPDLAYQLTPTASLEYLPADKAEAKVALLVEAASRAGNGAKR